MEKKYYQIEEVAMKTGLTKRAIRYYEDIELIKPIRTESKYRLYTEEDVEKISRIKELKDRLGFSLNEVRVVFDLEQNIKGILRGEINDSEIIDYVVKAIEEEIKLIGEKEQTLIKAKSKYSEILTDIKSKQNR